MSLLANRYAKALYELSREQKTHEDVHDDLLKIKDAVAESSDFTEFLRNPAIPSEKIKAILKDIFKNTISKQTSNFLMFLAHKKRLSILGDICESYAQYYREGKNILKVKIFSSVALASHQRDRLSEQCRARFKKEIEPEFFVDSRLLGGIKIQVGDQVYDYSIRTQLERFEESLITS